MKRYYPLVLTLFSVPSYSKIIKVDECTVSIFGFCPLESILSVIFVVILFLSVGFPLRKLIHNHFVKQKLKNPLYEQDPILVGIYRYSFYVTFGLLVIIFLLFQN
jgi:hypothetical protein